MASGILLQRGQEWVLDSIKYYIENYSNNGSGAFVGLMTNTTQPSETGTLTPGEITELVTADCSGYERLVCSGWSITSGVDPYIQGTQVTFTASGVWSGVYGYFVTADSGVENCLWTEHFPASSQGDRQANDSILITPKYEQKDDNEA